MAANAFRMFFVISAFALAGCVTQSVVPVSAREMESVFSKCEFNASNGVSLPFRAYVPKSSSQVPAIICLHGLGLNGSDNSAQLDSCVGSVMSVSEEKEEYSAAVFAPQCPSGKMWRDSDIMTALEEFSEHVAAVSCVSYLTVTGFSMGGDATWKLILRCPELFHAAMPVCGGTPSFIQEEDDPDVPEETAEVAIWAFNAFDDEIVRPDYAKRVFSRLWSYGKNTDALNFTMNMSGGHDAKPVYGDRRNIIWLIEARKRADCTKSMR